MYTQPVLYGTIQKHPDTLSVYGQRLMDEGIYTSDDIKRVRSFIA